MEGIWLTLGGRNLETALNDKEPRTKKELKIVQRRSIQLIPVRGDGKNGFGDTRAGEEKTFENRSNGGSETIQRQWTSSKLGERSPRNSFKNGKGKKAIVSRSMPASAPEDRKQCELKTNLIAIWANSSRQECSFWLLLGRGPISSTGASASLCFRTIFSGLRDCSADRGGKRAKGKKHAQRQKN